jgi:hypothetical protein
MKILKQSTAYNLMVFMTDSADHISGKTGLTLTVTASKDGGAFASITPAVTERGNGWYNLALTTTHTDTVGDLAGHVTAVGADPADFVVQVFGFANSIDSNVVSMAAGAINTAAFAVGTTLPRVTLADTLTTYTGNTPQTGDAFARIGAAGAGLTALPSAATVVSTLLATAGLTVRALDSVADASITVQDCLIAALCGVAGKESVASTTYMVKTPSTGTVIRTFTLDSATSPTSRT